MYKDEKYKYNFRCGIPVVIMGETGCGKTRLVKFLCALKLPAGEQKQNMIIVKVCKLPSTYDQTDKCYNEI